MDERSSYDKVEKNRTEGISHGMAMLWSEWDTMGHDGMLGVTVKRVKWNGRKRGGMVRDKGE